MTSLAPAGSPRWSPDGRRIAFDSSANRSLDIYVMDHDGGSLRSLTGEDTEDSRPRWSRDGRWIYFNSNGSGATEIWKVPAEGGGAIQVTQHGGFNAIESVDGRFLYYAKQFEPGIWRLPVDGGEEAQVLPGPDDASRGGWVVVDDGIYFVEAAEAAQVRAKWFLKFFAFATGKVVNLVEVQPPFPGSSSNYLDVSPDRRWFLYNGADKIDSDLMLIENFY